MRKPEYGVRSLAFEAGMGRVSSAPRLRGRRFTLPVFVKPSNGLNRRNYQGQSWNGHTGAVVLAFEYDDSLLVGASTPANRNGNSETTNRASGCAEIVPAGVLRLRTSPSRTPRLVPTPLDDSVAFKSRKAAVRSILLWLYRVRAGRLLLRTAVGARPERAHSPGFTPFAYPRLWAVPAFRCGASTISCAGVERFDPRRAGAVRREAAEIG
jgi:hypothetical protein